MDWNQAIERQREALAGIIASLFAMVGLADSNTVSRLPFPVYRAALRILYPAESAVRRLIIAVARGLVGKLPVRRQITANFKTLQRNGAGRLAFQLIDSRRSINFEPLRSGPKSEPRIHAFSNGQLVTILGRSPLDPVTTPVESVDAARLCRRLAAIKSALENLPREAKRLARWKARRAILPVTKFRKPLRPGRPPGHRPQSFHTFDEVLKDCHWLAWQAAKLDTS